MSRTATVPRTPGFLRQGLSEPGRPRPKQDRRCGSNRNGSGDPTLTRTLVDVYKVYDLFVMIFFLERAGGAPAERLPPRIHLNRRPLTRQLIGENRGPSIS